MGPLSLVLYSVIFDRQPAERAEEVARRLLEQRPAAELRLIVQEIREELAHPSQNVRDILPGMMGDEAGLREFLRRCADLIEPAKSR